MRIAREVPHCIANVLLISLLHHARILQDLAGKAKDVGLKELWHDFFVLLSSSVRHTILSTVLLVFLDEFVVTKVVILQRTAPLKTVKAWVNQKQVYMVQLFHSTIMLLLFLELKLKSHIVEVYILIFCSHAHYFL